jgi:hypothetical protein
MKWISTILCSLILGVLASAFAHAGSNVVFKVVVVNPSKDMAQPATVKTYLPREVKSDDIVNKGDLQAVYDAQQGAYFVVGEVELKPGEVWEQEVELRDVWFIADAELASLKTETAKYVSLLKDTEFSERVQFLCNSINEKLDQLQRTQKLEPANPEQRIAGYRDNLKVLEAVRAQLADVRTLLAQAKPFSMGAVWGMILAIVIFLAILGGTFYFIWFRQLRTAQLPSDFDIPSDPSSKGPVQREETQKRPEKDVDQVLGQ